MCVQRGRHDAGPFAHPPAPEQLLSARLSERSGENSSAEQHAAELRVAVADLQRRVEYGEEERERLQAEAERARRAAVEARAEVEEGRAKWEREQVCVRACVCVRMRA